MSNIPLAERIRPKNLDDFIGQEHLIGKKGILINSISNKVIPSIIFWGPPGVGKTTLANIIAKSLDRPFYTLSAINSGVKDVREVIEKASSLGLFGTAIPILFIDEIHTVIGAGAVLLENCGDHLVSYGVPAKERRSRKQGETYL